MTSRPRGRGSSSRRATTSITDRSRTRTAFAAGGRVPVARRQLLNEPAKLVATALLDALGLAGRREFGVDQLSGGEKQSRGCRELVAVAVPYARSLRVEERAAALYELGRRWRPLGWGALAILVVTGLPSAYEHGALGQEALLQSDSGRLLLLKGALVVVLVAFAALHDFMLAPRLARQIRARHPHTARPLLVRVGWASFALTLAVPVLGVVLTSELSHR